MAVPPGNPQFHANPTRILQDFETYKHLYYSELQIYFIKSIKLVEINVDKERQIGDDWKCEW